MKKIWMWRGVFLIVGLVIILVSHFSSQQIGNLNSTSRQEVYKDYDYLQLSPEETTWTIEEDGTFISSAGVIRGDTFYQLSKEEYIAIMYYGEDTDEVLAARWYRNTN